MIPHIIHNPARTDRRKLFEYEMQRQGITEYDVHPAVIAKNSVIGISRAHKNVVRYAMKKRLSEILIMEDDVKFPAPDGLKYFLSKKPEDFDLYLGGIYFGLINENNITRNFSGLHCYIIHHRFYKTFLIADENRNIDRWLAARGKYVVCNPFAALQYDGYSDARKMYRILENVQGRQIYTGEVACVK